MSTFIEEFYYGNIEPQEVNSELTSKLKKKLSNLAEKEEQLTAAHSKHTTFPSSVSFPHFTQKAIIFPSFMFSYF